MLSLADWSVRERTHEQHFEDSDEQHTPHRDLGAVLSVTTRRCFRAATWLLSGEACVFKRNETFKRIF